MNLRDNLIATREAMDPNLYQFMDWKLGEPATDAEVRAFVEAVGFEPDSRFLDIFRACNGIQFAWVMWEGAATREVLSEEYANQRPIMLEEPGLTEYIGSFELPSLAELAETQTWHFDADAVSEGESTLPILGGIDEFTLRSHMRWIDAELHMPELDRGYYRTGLLLHPRFRDPVCVFTNDEAAALCDAYPMRARTFIELACAVLGRPGMKLGYAFNQGFSGDRPILELEPGVTAGAWAFDSDSEAALAKVHDQLAAQRG